MDVSRQHRNWLYDRQNKMDVRRAAFMDIMGNDKGVLVYLKRSPQGEIRKRSKAALADLQEGDILLTANGANCQRLNHSEAMETIDNSGDRLVLEIIRMPGGAPQPQQTQSNVFNGSAQPNFAQQRTTHTTVKQTFGGPGGQTRETRTEQTTVQGPYGGPQTTTVRREERAYGGGPVLQQVGNFRPPQSQPPQPAFGGGPVQFKVKDIKGQQLQQHQGGPSIISKRVDDGAITLDFSMGGHREKENLSPQFNPTRNTPVQEYGTQFGKPGKWQPPPQEYNHPSMSDDTMDGPPAQVPLWDNGSQEGPMSPMDSGYNPYESHMSDEPDTYDVATPKLMPATPGMKPVPLSKLLQESFDDQTPPESPSRLRKMILDPSTDCATSSKKIYSDSAFFEDPTSSYPTVEEQIKLARNVANVLTKEAAQQTSRGAKMFTKRKERAEKWIHENPEEAEQGMDAQLRPKPLSKPIKSVKFTPYKCIDPDAPTRAPTWKPTPPPPPALLPKRDDDLSILPASSRPKNVITAEQLEQIQLRAPKTEHNAIAPEKCFSLAAALHASKGRGGQIFAKRRAKSESWVVDESNVKSAPPKPRMDNPMLGHARAGLKKTPKPPSKTPWEAASEHPTGDIEGAFEHLNKRHTIGSDVFDSLQRKHGWPDPTMPTGKTTLEAEKKEGPNFKDFNRKPRGWQSGGADDCEKWSTSSIASEDSGSRKEGSLPRSISFKSEEDSRSTPTFNPSRISFDPNRAKLQSHMPHGATPPRMAFPVGGVETGATDL